MVNFPANIRRDTAGHVTGQVQILRNGTQVPPSATQSWYVGSSGFDYQSGAMILYQHFNASIVDSPSTTSALTYKVQVAIDNSANNGTFISSDYPKTIIAMEITP